ncbi:transmembrane protein 14C-like [Eucyclogobius newberryi]|uniref:transmembrane protein 14C-like n=1 Tax=Eucyclogobius newberryi TaxID=166745 RepID=UPI003B597220
MAADHVGLCYAALVTAGGIIGFIKAGSTTSLAAGLLFGFLAALGAYLNNTWISLGTCGTLALVMGTRFLTSFKLMPAGLMMILSVLMVLKIVSSMTKRHMTLHKISTWG